MYWSKQYSNLLGHTLISVLVIIIIKTHSSVLAAKKTKEDVWLLLLSRHTVVCHWPRKQKKMCGTQVCYLLVLQSCQIQPSVLAIIIIKTHSSVSAAKKTKEDMWHTSVLFTDTAKLPNSAFCISQTTNPISIRIYILSALHIHYFTFKNWRKLLQYFMTYLFLKIALFSSHFSSMHKNIYLSCMKITFPYFDLLNLEHQ